MSAACAEWCRSCVQGKPHCAQSGLGAPATGSQIRATEAPESTHGPWYVALVGITLLSAFVSMFFAVRSIRLAETSEERTVALYAASRSVALFAVAVVPAFGRFAEWAIAIAMAMTIVQGLDALVGIRQRRAAMILGPATLGVLNLVAILLFATVPR